MEGMRSHSSSSKALHSSVSSGSASEVVDFAQGIENLASDDWKSKVKLLDVLVIFEQRFNVNARRG